MSENTYKKLVADLCKYLPEPASPLLATWLIEEKVQLRISPARVGKLGDYRSPHNGKGHRISINHNLNPYLFLEVLIHELAHLHTFKRYGRSVSPHGAAWQNHYRQLLQPFLELPIFPPELHAALKKHAEAPPASACVDAHLYKLFRSYDTPQHQRPQTQLLEDLPIGAFFSTEHGRFFQKGELNRTRYRCFELSTARTYLLSGLTTVSQQKIPPSSSISANNIPPQTTAPATSPTNYVSLSTLPMGAVFRTTTGLELVKHKLRRTRFLCLHQKTQTWYTVPAVAKVLPLNTTS